jgi:hypothetical protein
MNMLTYCSNIHFCFMTIKLYFGLFLLLSLILIFLRPTS